MWRQPVGALAVLAMMSSACGGSGETVDISSAAPAVTAEASASDAAARTDAPASVVAGVGILEDAVERSNAAAPDDFGPAADGDELAVGDVVRTDATGFAQLDWKDGSLTRLDSDTTLAVAALGEADRAEIEIDLDVGRVWNNVRDLDDGESFRVTTDVGVAAVRGTVFLVQCFPDGSCFVAVFEGLVEVTGTDGISLELQTGQSTVLAADGSTGLVGPIPDDVTGDPWVLRNLDLDDGGSGEAVADDGATAVLTGDYDVVWTATEDTSFETEAGLSEEEMTGGAYTDLPGSSGATTTDLWTIVGDQWIPRTTVTLPIVPAGENRFTAGAAEQSVMSCDIPDNGTFAQFLEIEVDEVGEEDGATRASSLSGTFTVIEEFGDSETCRSHRFRGTWGFVATRIGPPSIEPPPAP